MDNQQMVNILLIVVCVFLLSIIVYIYYLIQNLSQKVQLQEYEINVSATIDDNTFGLLDKIIHECFMEYTVLNVEYKDITYIDAELEKEITKEVANKVLDRLSPTMISKISLVYNINNLSTLLSERVYLHTINYSIEKNTAK